MNKLIKLADELGPMVYHTDERYICFLINGQPHTAILEKADLTKPERLVVSGNQPGCRVYRTPHVAEAFLLIRGLSNKRQS